MLKYKPRNDLQSKMSRVTIYRENFLAEAQLLQHNCPQPVTTHGTYVTNVQVTK